MDTATPGPGPAQPESGAHDTAFLLKIVRRARTNAATATLRHGAIAQRITNPYILRRAHGHLVAALLGEASQVTRLLEPTAEHVAVDARIELRSARLVSATATVTPGGVNRRLAAHGLDCRCVEHQAIDFIGETLVAAAHILHGYPEIRTPDDFSWSGAPRRFAGRTHFSMQADLTLPAPVEDGYPIEPRAASASTAIPVLSEREVEVLALVAEGMRNKEIGAQMGLSDLTVKSHLARIARKLGTGDRAGMVGAGMRAGIIT